jgi:hypothetical protein
MSTSLFNLPTIARLQTATWVENLNKPKLMSKACLIRWLLLYGLALKITSSPMAALSLETLRWFSQGCLSDFCRRLFFSAVASLMFSACFPLQHQNAKGFVFSDNSVAAKVTEDIRRH